MIATAVGLQSGRVTSVDGFLDPDECALLNDDLRPRRSVLYMPGANERALEKAKTLPADALILDLEDAVAPDAKVEARARATATR